MELLIPFVESATCASGETSVTPTGSGRHESWSVQSRGKEHERGRSWRALAPFSPRSMSKVGILSVGLPASQRAVLHLAGTVRPYRIKTGGQRGQLAADLPKSK